MTNGIVTSPAAAPPQFQQTTRVQEVSAQRAQSFDLSYRDGDGNAFNLSVSRETSYHSVTYDRTAQVRNGSSQHTHHARRHRHGGHGLRDQLKELRKEINETTELLRDAGLEVKGFKRLMHRMLKAVDRGYRDHYRHFDPIEQADSTRLQVHAEYVAVEEKLTVAMDRVDPEYWSAENTADRLTDFAVALYDGGDRTEHTGKMLAGMEQGYREAREAFGGALPGIARETLDLAAEKLAQWAEGVPAGTEPLELVA